MMSSFGPEELVMLLYCLVKQVSAEGSVDSVGSFLPYKTPLVSCPWTLVEGCLFIQGLRWCTHPYTLPANRSAAPLTLSYAL